MKKLLTAFALGLLLVGCAKEYDDTELRNRITTLETKVGNLEANMKALQTATADGMFVQSVEQFVEDGKVVGVTITYTTGKVEHISIDGAGAETNISAIRNSDGVLCWALNGVILKDSEGNDLTVGQTPTFTVKDGHLLMTVDGKTTDLGAMGGGLGDTIFKDIQVTDKAVILTLDDGSTVEIPFSKAFKLVIAKTQYAVTSTDPFDIPYTVENKTANTVVDVFTDANYEAAVDAEKITITPLAVAKGSALAYADSQVGLTSIVKLNFGSEGEADLFEITDSDINYIAEATNATVEAHAVSNIAFEVQPQVSWIHHVSTKAQNYTITLSVDDNPTNEIRTGEVKIVREGTGELLQTITIAQKASEIEYEHYNPAGWEKVFDMSDYKTNSTFIWNDALSLNPGAVTLQWKFFSNKWNNHKFQDKDASGNQLYANRLGEFANADESKSVLFRFSNDGDADGQLCLNAGALGLGQVQVSKDNQPYVWKTGEWVVMSIVADGSQIHVYDNDVLVASYDYTPQASWDLARFDLSMTWDDGSSWPLKQAFNGYTAYARVWSRALSQSEISETLCDVASGQDDGLEIYWKFDGTEEKAVVNSASRNSAMELDFTNCWDGNGNAKDNGDAAAAAWTTIAGSDVDGLCSKVKGSDTPTPGPDPVGNTVKALSFAKEGAQNWYVFQNDIDLTNGYTYVVHFLANNVETLWPIMMKMSAKQTQVNPTCHRFMNSQDRTGFKDFAHIAVSWNNGTSKHIPADKTLEANTWYSLAWTNDATTGPRLYLDGELVGQGEADADAISKMFFGAIEFGDSWGDDGYTPKPFPGCLAMISVWDTALSADEVGALVKKAPANLKDEHLKAYWPMLEGEGGVCKEATGKYEDIDFHYGWSDRYGGTYGTGEDLDNTAYLEWVDAPYLDGSTSGQGDDPTPTGSTLTTIDFANVTNWYLFQEDIDLSSGYSYVFHVYVDEFDASGHTYIGKFSDKKPQGTACNNRIRFGETNGKPGEFEWCIDGGPRLKSAEELEAGKWYSIALTADASGNEVMYIDGVAEAATGTHPGIASAKFGAFEFADSWGTNGEDPRFFKGSLAMISVWDTALSADEVAALVKKAPANLNDSHLKAYWPMTDGNGAVCKEATGKYEDIEFKYTWSDRYGSSPYGTGEDLDMSGNVVWKEYPAM